MERIDVRFIAPHNHETKRNEISGHRRQLDPTYLLYLTARYCTTIRVCRVASIHRERAILCNATQRNATNKTQNSQRQSIHCNDADDTICTVRHGTVPYGMV